MGELTYKTLRENVMSEIRMKILNREFAPGTRIVEQSLSKEFGISRGPIREALRQLEQEGLVEYTRNSGCSVREITLADVYELYLLRSSYEILAVRLCGGVFTQEELGEMEHILADMRTLQDGDIRRLVSYDHMFHRIIISKPGLPRLLKAWESLDYGSLVVGTHKEAHKCVFANHQYTIHRKLFDVLQDGDEKLICQAIYDHYMLPMKKTIQESDLPADAFKFFESGAFLTG